VTGAAHLLVAILSVAVLYATIWPHELGHSAAAFLFGCKSNWWETDTSWFLWGSWGGGIDYDCLRERGGPALGITEFAGIAVNLALLGIALGGALAPPAQRAANVLATRRLSRRIWLGLFALYTAPAGAAMGAARIVLT
jgi:hypothetical protein